MLVDDDLDSSCVEEDKLSCGRATGVDRFIGALAPADVVDVEADGPGAVGASGTDVFLPDGPG